MKTIRKGDRGEEVKTLQRALGVTADGIFGAQTESVLKEWQFDHGLVADGICGVKTWAALGMTEEVAITDGHITMHMTPALNREVRYIAIHYTAGTTSRRGSALATRNVFLNRKASADFVVDDDTIVLINPDIRNYYCWAVGDTKNAYSGGGKLYGKATNRNTVSIEICSNLTAGTTAAVPNHSGWYFTEQSLDNARRLVRYLMRKYGVPKECVVRHYDISGKPCPGVQGWNDAQLYDTSGKVTAWKNNSDEWKKFWESI